MPDVPADVPRLSTFADSVNDLPHPVEVTNGDGVLVYVNAAFEHLFGFTREEALGRSPPELLHSGADAPEHYQSAWSTVTSGRVWFGRFIGERKDGHLVHTDTVLFPFYDQGTGERLFVAVRRDVSEEERLRAQLEQSDRLAALGQLAAGMAHEINNPLTYVLANCAAAVQQVRALPSGVPGKGALEELLEEAEAGAERIRGVVTELSAFSRPAGDELRALDVRNVLERSVRLSQNELRHRATVVRTYEDVPRVMASERRLTQVFVNLLVNAAQAMTVGSARGNRIELRTRTDDRGRATVEVADTGPGIPADSLARVFEPFVTTKEDGLGTGLGLTICRTIVEEHDGRIVALANPGGGALLRVTLPAAPESAARSPAVAAAVPPSAARILVVDDERAVARTLARALAPHDVSICATGGEAFSLVTSTGFDAVFCDLMMPDMTGMELFERVEKDHPELAPRFIFVTGGAFTDDADAFVRRLGDRCLSKPFDLGAVRRALQRVLGAA